MMKNKFILTIYLLKRIKSNINLFSNNYRCNGYFLYLKINLISKVS